jgi:hypothetical protein
MLVLTVDIYARRLHKQSGFLAVLSFFILMYYFINLQFAPFTMGLVILFLALVSDVTLRESRGKTIITLLLFLGMIFTHPFIPLFFILYRIALLIQVPSGKREELYFVMLGLTVYFLYQFSLAPQTFFRIIAGLESSVSDYSALAQSISTTANVPIDSFAQTVSRVVVVFTSVLVGLGFLFLIWRRGRKFAVMDKAILLSGIVCLGTGFALPLMGTRGITLVGLAICSGGVYVLHTRLKKFVTAIFIILLAIFVFLPIHNSFYDQQIFFFTPEEYSADSFVLSHYNWSRQTSMVVHYRVATYLLSRQDSNVTYETDASVGFLEGLENAETIFYTVGLGKSLERSNSSISDLLAGQLSNVVYDNGFSSLIVRNLNSSLLSP